LNTLALQIGTSPITVDDPQNPRRGWNASVGTTISSSGILRSSFNYTQTIISASRFLPVAKNATLGFHLDSRFSTGVIPPSSLFTFSDQQLRGYSNVFYGTDTVLGQIELRVPLTADRKLTVVAFTDGLKFRIRGAYPLLDPYTNRITAYPGDWATVADMGLGLRFDVPQLGLHTVELPVLRDVDTLADAVSVARAAPGSRFATALALTVTTLPTAQ